MLFNSFPFLIFLPIVFILYWCIKDFKKQNVLLLIASYFFYSCWDWRFLFLLVFSVVLDFYSGLKIEEAQTRKQKRKWLFLSIIINVSFLGVLKYYNFFAASFISLAAHLGFHLDLWVVSLILPVGISFYTFHGLSYIIDVYKERIKAERNFIDYSLFVSYFPLLVAGPIERATHLLPQIKKPRFFNHTLAADGLRQILWGLFKKVVIADSCAVVVNSIFEDYAHQTSGSLVLGAIFFSFQIYGDFSGYSDIALGTSRLFGIELLRNFNFPYFSRDIAEFWRRWHISLSSWFKDYLYIPLGGSKGGTWMKVRNTFIIFIVSGFWHGANWTFIAWGALNAFLIMPSIILSTNRHNLEIVAKNKLFPSAKETIQILVTFTFTTIAWVFFRSPTIKDAVMYLRKTVGNSLFTTTIETHKLVSLFLFIVILLVVEWFQRQKKHGLDFQQLKVPVLLRWSAYVVLIFGILLFNGESKEFIYFQF